MASTMTASANPFAPPSGESIPVSATAGSVVGSPAASNVDEADTAEFFELPGSDLCGEELSVRVVPKQADEFTCSTCFLVHHRHRYAGQRNGEPICHDCAS